MNDENKFFYLIHYCPNPDCIQVQARIRFPKGLETDQLLDFEYASADPTRAQQRHPFYNALAGIEGLKSASGGSYNLQLSKANGLFTWEELLPSILEAIRLHLADGAVMTEAGEPIRPSKNLLKSLRKRGCDV